MSSTQYRADGHALIAVLPDGRSYRAAVCDSPQMAADLARALSALPGLAEALSDVVEDIEQWGLMDGDPWPALDRAIRELAELSPEEASQ